MLIRLDRDSVAARDDVEAHDEQREVDGRRPLERFIADLVWDHYLPAIQGGQSCWVLRRSRKGEPLGVVRIRYGRFEGLQLLHRDSSDLSEVGDSLFFEYATQEDPDEVFARLLATPYLPG
jgi:hypothetical protein